MTRRAATQAGLRGDRLSDTRGAESHEPATLLTRVQELETLCGEVYLAAVELALPRPLLNRLKPRG
jgi:hypothetical protein